MKEGWSIAIGEYNNVLLNIKHCNILDYNGEAILCPITETLKAFPISQGILKAANIEQLNGIEGLTVGCSRDIPSGDLPHTRIILCVVPEYPEENMSMKAIQTGLEIANSLGCVSACIPVEKILNTWEASVDILIESFEQYALCNLSNNLCMREVTICLNSIGDIKAAIEASKFRMTRYSSFINIGLPTKESIPGFYYCYECYKMNSLNNKCPHFS